jgi:CheY-like chemotaxis protein
MPVLDGIAAARKLREADSPTRIIFLTGIEDSSFQQAAMEAGGQAYVFKSQLFTDLPRAITAVMREIRSALGRARVCNRHEHNQHVPRLLSHTTQQEVRLRSDCTQRAQTRTQSGGGHSRSMTYRIATIPTLNGTRFYIEANGKRRQGGFATQQKAIAKIDELKAYDEIKIQRDLPPASAARLLRKIATTSAA